uniref:RNA helicase n=1 Tax=Caligus rogercresseyi TaxID=217165 RepID=C1BPP9_CALRO|nr:Probable ATP-dependent RNA helicase DDX49 [Caligus rogercresseyi]
MDSLGLKPWLSKQCEAIGLKSPAPVQRETVPKILDGQNGIGIAKTGSGKTAAFALPILDALSEDPYGIYALVLTPTRELAYQIADTFKILGKPLNVKVSIIIGGRDMVLQGSELASSPHIVIATPGRLADHLNTHSQSSPLKKIKFLVIDEADRLLEGGFDEAIGRIFASIPRSRQTLLFTATHSESLKELIVANSEKEHFYYREGEDDASGLTVNTLDQHYVLTPADFRDAYLIGVLMKIQKESPNASFIIFARTCKIAQILSLTLGKLGFSNVALHSMKPQRERLEALSRFRSHLAKILIATDVASRGLDIPHVEYVINHNIPTEATEYVHRVGRTARAGRRGTAISLLTPHDVLLLESIEELIGSKLSEYSVDTKNISEIVVQVNVTRRETDIRLAEADFDEKKRLNKRKKLIEQGIDPDEFERELKKKRKKMLKEQKRKRLEKKAGAEDQ